MTRAQLRSYLGQDAFDRANNNNQDRVPRDVPVTIDVKAQSLIRELRRENDCLNNEVTDLTIETGTLRRNQASRSLILDAKSQRSYRLKDPEPFIREDRNYWRLFKRKINTKLRFNNDQYPTDTAKVKYISTQLNDKVLEQLDADCNDQGQFAFTIIEETQKALDRIYENTNQDEDQIDKFQFLRILSKDEFIIFYLEFIRLAKISKYLDLQNNQRIAVRELVNRLPTRLRTMLLQGICDLDNLEQTRTYLEKIDRNQRIEFHRQRKTTNTTLTPVKETTKKVTKTTTTGASYRLSVGPRP